MVNVLVTGGGTVAPIDDVRQITNVSTGQFASQISEALLGRGAHVWHVHPRGAQTPLRRQAALDLTVDLERDLERLRRLHQVWSVVRGRLHSVPLETGTVADYARTLEQLTRSVEFDLVLLAMAVSDFEPEAVAGKLDSSRETLQIACRATPKVIEQVRQWVPGGYLVGFKLMVDATAEELETAALRVCERSGADCVVANDLRSVEQKRHVVHLVRPQRETRVLGPDPALADQVVDLVLAWVWERFSEREPIALDDIGSNGSGGDGCIDPTDPGARPA